MQRKYTAVTSATLIAAAFAAISGSVAASDGTITFSGSVVDNTCTVDVNGGSATNSVNLQYVMANRLAAVGNTANEQQFTIGLKGCPTDVKKVRAFFESGPNVDQTTFNLKNGTASGSATNVQVQLTDGHGKAIKVGDASQRQATPVDVSQGSATMTYGAQYYATGQATAGAVTTSVNYSIDYL